MEQLQLSLIRFRRILQGCTKLIPSKKPWNLSRLSTLILLILIPSNSSIPETSKSGQSSCVLVLLWTPLMAGTKSNQLWSTFGHRSAPRIFALLDGFAAHVGQLLVHFVPPCFLMKGLLPQQSRIKSHKILSADHGKTMPRVRPFVRLKPIALEWYRHIAGNVRQMKRYNLSALDQGRCQGW